MQQPVAVRFLAGTPTLALSGFVAGGACDHARVIEKSCVTGAKAKCSLRGCPCFGKPSGF